MKTTHEIYFKNSADMSEIEANTADLIVTSPPYPMIEMWDSLFSSLNEDIKELLYVGESKKAYDLMHDELNKIWKEIARVLKTGGFACINIGDATRKINDTFQLFPNHVDITHFFQNNGFITLPCILWRKPTNSPTKFLGSGMLPPNAYITLEHEYILIFRKGNKKRVIPTRSERRYNSAYFWEERNKWFSDIWTDMRGVSQNLNNGNEGKDKIRERSAVFPFKLPYRLINMFSIHGDMVLDPFWGTGTTSLAAMASARNSMGYEINPEFKEKFDNNLKDIKKMTDLINGERLQEHVEFVKNYIKEKKEIKYHSTNYNFRVITQQEQDILLYSVKNYSNVENKYLFTHEKFEFEFEKEKRFIQSRLIP